MAAKIINLGQLVSRIPINIQNNKRLKASLMYLILDQHFPKVGCIL